MRLRPETKKNFRNVRHCFLITRYRYLPNCNLYLIKSKKDNDKKILNIGTCMGLPLPSLHGDSSERK